MFPNHNISGLNGKCVVQHEEASPFHHHKINAASRSASTDGRQDLISCWGWLTFTEAALFGSISGRWLLDFEFQGLCGGLKVMLTVVFPPYHIYH